MIISGGQTGVDQAALDAARALGVEYGGWVPKGRKTEAGPLSAEYENMREASSASYPLRTGLNVRDSDATLILCYGRPTGGTKLTQNLANEMSKPVMWFDISNAESTIDDIVSAILHWLSVIGNPQLLNVAGPRASKCPGIYTDARNVMEALLNVYANRA